MRCTAYLAFLLALLPRPAGAQDQAPFEAQPRASAAAPGEGALATELRLTHERAGVLPEALRPRRDEPAAERQIPQPCLRFTYWGIGIGAVAGLVWGLSNERDDIFGLSPVLETAIGAGIGFYLGAAADMVRALRSPPCRAPFG